jgi:hypothetical protein
VGRTDEQTRDVTMQLAQKVVARLGKK